DFHCLPGWSAYDQYCYRVFNEPKNWEDAERFCAKQADSGHLVSIETMGEADFVAQLISENIQSEKHYVWIGLKVQNKEQQCSSEWSDGSSVTYENLIKLYMRKCGALEQESGFRKWINLGCIQLNPFVCKFPPQ
uniref:Snaclec alboaggregin-A subunit alpha' n=1 Tax=Trimeresurus albolabris TaxID=8765 RepID=SLA2_TRIAB|nr:RecName: Full=Snaclec alboaggregin-A subunit alpha'; AltName: Full=Alboaggregin-A subunit 2; Short=AL-A subunit 2 [Trimeresurus albolabris]